MNKMSGDKINSFIRAAGACSGAGFEKVAEVTQAVTELIAERDAWLSALIQVRGLLDGVDKWTPDDVLANALCAYSVAEDAIAYQGTT
jgi:hypothetical protein